MTKLKHKSLLLYSWFVRFATGWFPDAPITMRFRGWLYGLAMKRAGNNFQVASNVRINSLQNISVGNNSYIAPGSFLLISDGLDISDEVSIGPYVVIVDGDHTSIEGSYRYGGRNTKPISIGKGCWIASHVTITKGVTLGDGSIVGANSVVTKDIPAYTKAAGVPAKPLDQ